MKLLIQLGLWSWVLCCISVLVALTPFASAQNTATPQQGFALQVTPSPLVATIKPGESSTLELRIRNTNSDSQLLKMGLRSFTVNDQTGEVTMGNEAPAEVKDFVSFEQPTFNLRSGEIANQKIRVNTPKNAGFTYSFAITISRQTLQRPQDGSTAIEGSVAVFTLLNVDRPGATRKFEFSEFLSHKRVYEYLPASFDLRLRNTGNTLIQPKGNIFIQRKNGDKNPISTLPINEGAGYILPGSNRILTTNWSDGFPRYETDSDGNGRQKEKLKWQWSNLSKLRFGKYTAKAVAVYDDGQRDVPVVAEISFWVIPWKIIGIAILILIPFIFGFYTLLRRFIEIVRRNSRKHISKTLSNRDE